MSIVVSVLLGKDGSSPRSITLLFAELYGREVGQLGMVSLPHMRLTEEAAGFAVTAMGVTLLEWNRPLLRDVQTARPSKHIPLCRAKDCAFFSSA